MNPECKVCEGTGKSKRSGARCYWCAPDPCDECGGFGYQHRTVAATDPKTGRKVYYRTSVACDECKGRPLKLEYT